MFFTHEGVSGCLVRDFPVLNKAEWKQCCFVLHLLSAPEEKALNIQAVFLLSVLSSELWQVSPVIVVEKEIMAISCGPEAVSTLPPPLLYYTGWNLTLRLQHIKAAPVSQSRVEMTTSALVLLQ